MILKDALGGPGKMADFQSKLLTQRELAALVPSRFGGKTSAQTIRRWQIKGLRGVFLGHTVVGAIRCSTEADLQAFFERLTQLDHAARFAEVDQPVESPSKAEKQAGRRRLAADAEAKRLGL
jgi:hypothetical protein